MISGTKTILVFEDGSTMEAASGGDQYWIVSPNGTAKLCPLAQACRYWDQYEASMSVGPQPISLTPTIPVTQVPTSTPPVSSNYIPPPEARPPTPRVVCGYQDQNGGQDYSPWQRELLDKLGLRDEDINTTEPSGKSGKGKKKKK